MEHIKKIIVSIQFDEQEIEVGELVSNKKLIFFKYDPNFLKRGLEISPIKLKLNNGSNNTNNAPFEIYVHRATCFFVIQNRCAETL